MFTDAYIDAYIELKMQEVTRFRMTTHPVEFDMYYSLVIDGDRAREGDGAGRPLFVCGHFAACAHRLRDNPAGHCRRSRRRGALHGLETNR